MARQSRSLLGLVLLAAAGVQVMHLCASSFIGGQPAASPRVARAAYESGKVNLDSEVESRGSAAVPPEPVIECDSSCISAIEECLDEGCSVEAMMKLDQQLAADEAKIQGQMVELEQIMKKDPVPEAATQMAWLKNFLDRTGTLRAQLVSMKPLGEKADFAAQFIKAASVAFGGGRETDYPKTGVSPYTA